MKSLIVGVLIALLCVSSGFAALEVVEVQLLQDVGCVAEYNASTQVLKWYGGASGILMTDDPMKWDQFSEVEIEAELQGLTDLSAGGLMQGKFSSGTWDIKMSVDSGSGVEQTVHLSGQFVNPYTEVEAPDGLALDGRAVVTVDVAEFNVTYFGAKWGYTEAIEMQWGDGNGLGGLMSSILFPLGTVLTDYSTDYRSTNASITLVADETSIPEPATMALLGLGSLLVFRKRS